MTLTEVQNLIDRLLCRKERGNGIGRRLFFRLSCGLEPEHVLKGTRSGFRIMRSLVFANRFSVILVGNAEALIRRINQGSALALAKEKTRSTKAVRRLTGKKLSKEKTPRALPGANGKLHWHFRNHDLLFEDAVRIIAKACRRPRNGVRKKLIDSLDDRGVGSYRLQGGFVFRIDVACVRSKCFDLLAPLQLRTTDDNTHMAYRRLRGLLKAQFGCESKTRQQADAAYFARKREEWIARRYA